MAEQNPRTRGIEKKKVLLFLVLVAAAMVCLVMLFYVLMNARPRTSPIIENGTPSSSLRVQGPGMRA